MRVLPNMTVLSPVDAVETEKMVLAMSQQEAPCYIRINRNDLPTFTNPDEPYHIGKMHKVLEGEDVVVFATGVMVYQATQAAECLRKEGTSLRVVNVSTIKPLDAAALLRHCEGMKGVVTAEEHSVYGGLGSAVCEALSTSRLPIEILGINDSFGRSAESYDLLLEHFHLLPEDVAMKARKVLGR
jgi:transketolase